MKKKIIYIIIIIIIIGLCIYGALNLFNKKNIVLNSKEVVDGINFGDVSIVKKDGKYIFKVSLSSDTSIHAESFDVEILDKKGNTLDTLSGFIGDINNGEMKEVEIVSTKNLSKAYQVSYTVFKE